MHMGITYIDSQEGAQNEPQSIFAPTRPFTYNIVAPKLAYLSTYLCPHALSFISAIQGVEILYTVEIFTTQRVHFRFDNLNLDCRAKGMLAKYARESAERMETVDWFKYANDLFSIPGLAEQSKLIVSNSDQPLDIDKINWTELTELEIVSSSLDICNVIKLIARLPNLVSLRLAGIKAETLSNGTLVAFGYLANPFPTDKPISTRLREIALTLDNEKYTESTKSQIAECFYSRIPTLEVFKISNFA
ncbi:hypothetical protein GGI25_001688 [Coemansia spiralis]|uniref:Uncharacterized protein n=2 Tax=Coemansia TaxID=4863 RepID=A0A9W8GAP5_9FUNG|nr:hypothetical protein EDC05_006029 [Coemansia umbellata]KAJ2623881.1 hypothetical protein GGI26_001895 [Coemansia sp. RSA 1358]KAJ2679331.1 hypothetical protein GGI25_001688 [Coemansia spiralis]